MEQSFGRRRSFFPSARTFRWEEALLKAKGRTEKQESLICWDPLLDFFVKEDHCRLCFIFRTFPVLFLLLSCFSLSPLFQACSLWCPWELPTCPPAHHTHPRWASVLNSKLKTHYWAISPLIMLSNDLISLSVSPVSHQRPCQLGCPCPRASSALRYHRRRRPRRVHLVSACPHQKQDRTLNLWKYVKAKWLGTQGVRDFGMKVLGISFTISTLLVREAQSIRAPFWFEGSQGRELGHGKMADGHGVAIPAQPKSVWRVGVCKMDYYHTYPKRHRLSLLAERAALSMCGEGSEERGQGWAPERARDDCVCACVCVCLLPRSPSKPFCEMIL